jgi:hypothetical protein
VLVAGEGVAGFAAQVEVDAANGQVHGRQAPGGKAISVLNVDSPVSNEILDKIKKLENILAVKVIRL